MANTLDRILNEILVNPGSKRYWIQRAAHRLEHAKMHRKRGNKGFAAYYLKAAGNARRLALAYGD